jgi:hypothetical protein
MSSFDEYRKKLTEKYGSKPKKTEDEQEKKPTAIDGASVWDDSFESTRKDMTARYGGGMDFSKVKDWFTESESTLNSISEYYKANEGKWVSNYGGDFASKLDELLNASSSVGFYLRNNKKEFADYDSVSKALSEYRSFIEQYKKQNSSMAEFYSQFATEDEYNTWYEDYKKKQEVLTAEDYEEYSQKGAAIENPTYREADGYLNIFGWRPFGEDVGNIVTFSRENETAIRFAGDTAVGDFRYAHMTDEEVGIYNYYLAKYGNDKANEYLQSIDDELDKREAGEIAKLYNDNIFLEPILGFTAGIETSVEGLKSLADFVTGNDSGTDYSATQYADQIMASDNKGILKGVHDVSSVIGGMTPAIFASALTGNPLVGASMMGGSAMGNAYTEMIDLGYNQWQARGYGILVGASETALNYLLGGIGKLGGKVTGNAIGNFVSKFDNAIARTAIQLGGNMASEGIEEGLQTVLEPAFKALVTGETFEAPEWEEVWYSALLGALSAGVMEGAPTIANTAIGSYQANKVYGAEPQALVGEALEIDPENAHARRMKAKLDSGKNISGYQLNRLVGANEQALYNQDKSKMTSAAEARLTELGESGDVSKLASALVKQASGEALSMSEKNLIKNSKHGQRVSNELSPDNIKSGEYTSKWAEGIGTERINTEAYNKSLYDLASEKAGVPVATEEASVSKNPTAKETPIEAKFEASTDGKTRIGDLEVSIKEIASVKDGEVVLRLEDGSTVNAIDVEFGSPEETSLYDAVSQMNVNAATANAFIKGYDHSMSVNEYALGFREAYRYGEYGIRMNDMSTKGFSAMLSESQKSLAYELGKTDMKYKIEARQNAIAKMSSKTASPKSGKVHYAEGIRMENLTQRQQASLKGIETLANALGVDIHIFESQVVDGKRQGANGWFDRQDGSIHIDLHAGLNGEGTMLFTASHELTHFIREWSPSKFKVFADSLLEEYGNKDVSVETLVSEQIAKAKRNGRDISYDIAYEEVIADSCEAMLADGDIISKIAKIKAKDKSLWQKIKDFITDLVAKIKAAYEGMTPDSVEGRFVSEMLDKAENLKALWTDALAEASDAYQASDIVAIDTESQSVSPMFSERTWTESDYVVYRDQMAEKIAKALDVSVQKAKSYIDDINSIAKMIADDRARLDYEASSFGSAFVSNVEYGGSFDYTTLCKKRRIYTGTFTEIQKRLKDVALTPDDILTIRNLMLEEGIEATCGLCYVEGSRANMGKFAKEFIRLYKRDNPLAWIPNMADVNTPDGVEQMRISHPEAYDQYVYFWNHYGKLKDSDPALFASQQKPKLYEARKEYKGEILEHFEDVSSVAKKNRNGGIRMQSFSDFEIVHLIDTMQVIMDMSTVGLAGQAYTKVPEFAKAFGNTGLKINLSLIAKGVDADGNLIFDDREGMPHKTAFELRDRYSKNVGTIIVTFTDQQLLAAMADPRIDFIIPFHRSQWKKGQYGAMGLPKGTKDYTFMQNEKLIKKTYHEYRGRMVLDKASNYMPNEYWDFSKSGKENAEAYLKMCAENNKRPKFYKLLDYDGKGTYSLKKDGSTDGYWKLLIDFKMYDNNGVGSPQNAVTPTFNMDEAKTMLDEYQGGHSKYPVASSVVDTFVDKYNQDHGTKYSDRDSYAPTFYSHMGKVVDGIKSEKVGANGVVPYLKGKGVKAEEIKWSGIEAFLEGKKSVTKEELQEFVAGSQLQIVEQVSGEDIDLRYDGSKRAYNLYDADGKVIDTFTYNSFLDGYVAESDEEIYSNGNELTEALREAYGVASAPRWADYKINGGSNYRELVFQLPDSTFSNRAMRAHWGQDAEGVLAHARIQDITTSDGKKMLFIEEIQSDWHNEGHQKGYSTEEYEDAVAVYDKLAKDYDSKRKAFNKYVRSGEFRSDPDEVSKKKFDWLRRKMDEAEKRMQAAERDIEALKEKGMGDVPDAPFRNNYHEYVLKRLLRMAAEEGYDSIGWTPAEIQSMRWSDEFAEGYRIEYDQDIPSFLKKYGKKWGATVGKERIGEYFEQFEVDLDTMEDSDELLLEEGIKYDGIEVWSMDIPDSMKDSVLHEGQVLYSDRSFASQVDAVLNGADTGSTHLKLMDTPSLLQEAGLPNLPILMTAKHLKKITAEKGHGLDVEIVKKLPEYISSPVMIADSLTRDDSIVIITEAIDSEDRPVVAAILLNGSGRLDGEHINANIMTSAYGKDNFQSFLNRVVDSDSVIYWDKKKSQDLSVSLGLQLPNAITSLRSNTIIHQAKAFVNTQTEKTLHSDRDPDSVSNRSLLANALESVAQNDIERRKLEEYKSKIALIESEQAKLAEIRAKIKELSFAKGKRDTEAIKSLQFDANQTANRINTYDKQLLNLESTKALKDVLQREKELAYKRAERRGKDALSAYREKAAKTQRELMTRYQESRKKNVEGRKQTAMRHKIKDVVNELNQYLLKGTKDKHVPIELQKAVAEALGAVNMDTVGAEERLAKIHDQLQKNPFDHHLLESYRRISEQGERMDGKLQALKNAYDDIVNSNDPLIANSHDEVISNSIEKVIKEVGSTPLRDMTLAQLESVYDMYKMVLTTIRNTNKAFKAAKSEEISVIANRVMEEIDGLGKKKPYRTKVSQALSKFDWNNLKPVYAFDRIGSNTFTEVFNNVRAGEDTWAVDITEAKNFSLEQHKKFKYDSWDFKKRYGFTSSSGMHFELSLDQIMSLYAYSKREQARDHLKKGGIVIDETTEVTVKNKLGIPVKFNPTEATAYNLSDETLADIIGKLTTEQKAFVDVMQDYLSTTMGDKGNEVSLALYGVKLYKEKHYFPLKSAQQFMAKAKEQQKGEVKIKNSGFSKETVTKASNPIVLTPFMDVWADHVNEMSMYHAFVLPLEDFYRVYNYKTPTSDTMPTESVEMYLQNSYGKGATQYIDQLLKDLNGGARVDSTVGIINKLTGLFKKSAVFASLSVVVQQPSAIARATALVDTKYFAGVPSGKHSETWAEVKKYAPVAVIKEMGYFDTGMGQSTVEWLKGEKTWKDKIDDIASKAPALADELAWCSIWNAVKRETLNTHKDLKYNSEEFLKAVGERFTEVVTKTQVYDSVLSRSANMRSKDTGMKMATAFMGEPTTSLNMLENALTQGKRGNKRYARKAVGSVVASMILNSILVSFVYAGRDDDEDKTYAEKYIGTLTEELIDSFNPLTLMPFAKDIVSIAQGYDVERSDMAVITDIINAWNNLENDNRSVYRKVEDFAGAIASLFGLPVKNIMRDARGMYNTVNSFINGEKTTGAGIGVAVTEAVTGKEKSNGQLLYDAIIKGDKAQADRLKSRFEDQKAIDSAIRKALRDNDPRIKQAAEARYNGDIAEYMRIAKAIIAEGNFSQDNIVSAINSEINTLKKGEGTSESTTSNKVKSMYEMSDYYSALEGRDQATAYVVKEDLIKTDMANGKDRDEAEADFNSKFASHLRDLYDAGDISDSKAEDMLVSYGGKSEEEAFSKVQYWEFRKQYPDYDLSEEAVTKYYNDVEPSGIGIDVYYDYSKQRSKCKGTDSDGDGKTDSGSVKTEVLQVINSLPITSTQKDALYYLNGWAASTIWQAPWH